MLVFGGNTHNDTSMSHGAKCFSSDFLVYNLGKQQAGRRQRGAFGWGEVRSPCVGALYTCNPIGLYVARVTMVMSTRRLLVVGSCNC